MNEESNFGKIIFKDCINTNTSGERISYNTTLNTPNKLYSIEEIQNLEHQLQAYKDKEDKLRELCEAPIDNMSLNWQTKLILQILNEGDE